MTAFLIVISVQTSNLLMHSIFRNLKEATVRANIQGVSESSRTNVKREFYLNLLNFGIQRSHRISTFQNHGASIYVYCFEHCLLLSLNIRHCLNTSSLQLHMQLEKSRVLSPSGREDWLVSKKLRSFVKSRWRNSAATRSTYKISVKISW
jgi:hypothetical protein